MNGRPAKAFAPASSSLLLIDFQARLLPAVADAETAVGNARRLAKAAQLLGIPIFATEQNARGLGKTIGQLQGLAQRTLPKMHFDATKEARWPGFLPQDHGDVVVCGSETHVCVLQTVMGLLEKGHSVRLVRDAVCSRTLANRDAGLQRAERHGAELVTAEMMIFEWLESCDHPRFRGALQLIK